MLFIVVMMLRVFLWMVMWFSIFGLNFLVYVWWISCFCWFVRLEMIGGSFKVVLMKSGLVVLFVMRWMWFLFGVFCRKFLIFWWCVVVSVLFWLYLGCVIFFWVVLRWFLFFLIEDCMCWIVCMMFLFMCLWNVVVVFVLDRCVLFLVFFC